MLGWLLGVRDPLVRLSRGSDRSTFITALGDSDLVVLSLPFDEGLDPWSMTQEELLAFVEKNAKDLAEREDFPPFTYLREGLQCLPLFSTMKLAQEFVAEFSKEMNRVLPFQTLTIKGDSLRDLLLSAESVSLNPRTRHERLLTTEDLRMIAEIWASPCAVDSSSGVEGPGTGREG